MTRHSVWVITFLKAHSILWHFDKQPARTCLSTEGGHEPAESAQRQCSPLGMKSAQCPGRLHYFKDKPPSEHNEYSGCSCQTFNSVADKSVTQNQSFQLGKGHKLMRQLSENRLKLGFFVWAVILHKLLIENLGRLQRFVVSSSSLMMWIYCVVCITASVHIDLTIIFYFFLIGTMKGHAGCQDKTEEKHNWHPAVTLTQCSHLYFTLIKVYTTQHYIRTLYIK